MTRLVNEIIGLADFEAENGSITDPAEMAQVMKRVKVTPYFYLRLVIIDAIVKNNIASAEQWLSYAEKFQGLYFESVDEDQNFRIMILVVRVMLDLVKKEPVFFNKLEGE